MLEKDVDNLKKTYEDTQLDCKQTQKEIHLVKEKLQRLNQDHKNVSVTQASRAGGKWGGGGLLKHALKLSLVLPGGG